MEIGPYRLKDDAHLVYSDGAWDEFANLLFVDNPVGTGYSYVDTDSFTHELVEMANQLVKFLEKFFSLFPEYEGNDLYIAGESYAGQHIPYLAQAILDRNGKPTTKRWKLSGLLIGNGWISPVEQYDAYLDYAYKSGLIKRDSTNAKQLEARMADCHAQLNKAGGKDQVSNSVCETVLTEILRLSTDGNKCPNMYDVRLRDSYPSCGMNWPPDLEYVKPYLRRPEVIKALNVNKDKSTGWTECSGAVGRNFHPKSKPTITMLPNLLQHMPILLFSGDQDLICNHLGTEELIHNMEWNGGKGFELSPGTWAPRRHWTFEGESAGIYQEARNLTYVLFYNSSHMVPFDYPRRTRDMLDRFMDVDIASIGGTPADSRIDGEKGVETSVGGHPNSTTAKESEKANLEKAKWDAYYKSGEVALIVVIILASAWAWYVWRDRRRRAGYRGLFGESNTNLFPGGGMGLGELRSRRQGRDVEAADFDENELDDLHVQGPQEDGVEDRYSLGGESSDGEEKATDHTNGDIGEKGNPYHDEDG